MGSFLFYCIGGGEELKEVEKKPFKQYKKKQGNVLSTDNKRPILCAASR